MLQFPQSQTLWKKVLADGETGPHAEHRCVLAFEKSLNPSGVVEQGRSVRQQGATAFVERQPSTHSIEKLNSKRTLEIVQRIACSRLRPRHTFSSCASRSRSSHGDEDFQLSQRHAESSGVLIRHLGHRDAYCPLSSLCDTTRGGLQQMHETPQSITFSGHTDLYYAVFPLEHLSKMGCRAIS
jgi:hypothetical protein